MGRNRKRIIYEENYLFFVEEKYLFFVLHLFCYRLEVES